MPGLRGKSSRDPGRANADCDAGLITILEFLTRPIRIFRDYRISYLRPDAIAGLTVAVVMLPQAMAYALIAELPPQMGLYSAVVGSVVGALWGSSRQLQTGPTNTTSLLILPSLLAVAVPGTPEYLAAAGLMAIMVGLLRLAMGLARLGVLVNFISDSVIVGFTAGAGVLIAINQVRILLRLPIPSTPLLWNTVRNILVRLPETHWQSLAIGLGLMLLTLALGIIRPTLPGLLIGMIGAAGAVGLFGLDTQGVEIVGKLPRGLPPVADLPLLDIDLIGQLIAGSLAVGAIELVEVVSISHSIASQTGQRLDSDQEFVGQGLANITCGIFSGCACSGSFTRSAVNYEAGAKTSISNLFASAFVLGAMVLLAPLVAYVPLPALAGALILTGYGLIDGKEMVHIWRSGNSDRVIMVVTLVATLTLHLQYAVLIGIGLSIIYYLLDTSKPRVRPVKMSDDFRYFAPRPERPSCPQLGVVEILGDLYFGAANHIEERIEDYQAEHPRQRFLLLRMYTVENCDISGIHTLESITRTYRDRGGDVYFVHVQQPVLESMKATEFYDWIGEEHFLDPDRDVSHLFYKVLDPAICIYECPVRAFEECQNLPKQLYEAEVAWDEEISLEDVASIAPKALWHKLREEAPPLVIDVRGAREFEQAHIPGAENIPLPELLGDEGAPARDRSVVLVCRGGRRSTRAAATLGHRGYERVKVLEGGMLAWERENLLEAVDRYERSS